jgi:hypothetical protein
MKYYKVYLTLISRGEPRTEAACIAIGASEANEAKQIAENAATMMETFVLDLRILLRYP